MSKTQIRGHQIKLDEIFSVERMLAARGFTISESDQIQNTLLQKTMPTEDEIKMFFESFDSTEKRAAIFKSEVLGAGDKYDENQKRFSSTVEWYIGQLLVRKFQAFSSAFGVRTKNTIRPTESEMGDFDVLAVLGDMSLLYAECKTGGIKFIEVQKALERGLMIATAATIIIYQKDNDIRALLEGQKYPNMDQQCIVHEIAVANLENSNVLMWDEIFFLDARTGLENKLQTCLRLVAQRKNGYLQVFDGPIDFLSNRGFKVT